MAPADRRLGRIGCGVIECGKRDGWVPGVDRLFAANRTGSKFFTLRWAGFASGFAFHRRPATGRRQISKPGTATGQVHSLPHFVQRADAMLKPRKIAAIFFVGIEMILEVLVMLGNVVADRDNLAL